MSSAVPSPTAPAPPLVAPAPPVAPTPAPAAAGVGGATIAVSSQALAVTPGQVLAARVLAIEAGMIQLALAGGHVTAASDLPLQPGQTLRLIVDQADAERVTLKIAPELTTIIGASGGNITPAAALAGAGIPPSAAAALMAALAEQGTEVRSGASATTLAARAAAAGVTTPAQAAAFARLLTAGVATTPAAVAGLAQLIDGPPLGRALTNLLDAALARAGAAAGAAAGTPEEGSGVPSGSVGPKWAATIGPSGTPIAAPSGAPATAGTPTAIPSDPALVAQSAGSLTAPAGTRAVAVAAVPVAAAPPTAALPLATLVDSLVQLVRRIEASAVEGTPQALRTALLDLGSGLEARLASGSAPDHPPLRALALALADHPAADVPLARAASVLSDALAAQGLVGPTLTANSGALVAPTTSGAGADTTGQNGAYLQLPLPGGGTAEVRVSPDAGHDGEGDDRRPRRLAFLLHMSALGPVMIDASAGAAGVDATIRVGSDEVRRFLDGQAQELATALRRAAPAASVRVEQAVAPPPERLLAPPPSSGLDICA